MVIVVVVVVSVVGGVMIDLYEVPGCCVGFRFSLRAAIWQIR